MVILNRKVLGYYPDIGFSASSEIKSNVIVIYLKKKQKTFRSPVNCIFSPLFTAWLPYFKLLKGRLLHVLVEFGQDISVVVPFKNSPVCVVATQPLCCGRPGARSLDPAAVTQL